MLCWKVDLFSVFGRHILTSCALLQLLLPVRVSAIIASRFSTILPSSSIVPDTSILRAFPAFLQSKGIGNKKKLFAHLKELLKELAKAVTAFLYL